MTKLPMYIIMTIAMGLGGYIPVLCGADALGLESVLGSVAGGIVGIVIYAWLRNRGYIE